MAESLIVKSQAEHGKMLLHDIVELLCRSIVTS